MADDYDVFGNLRALDENKGYLEKMKVSLASALNQSFTDDDLDLSLEGVFTTSLTHRRQQYKKPTVRKSTGKPGIELTKTKGRGKARKDNPKETNCVVKNIEEDLAINVQGCISETLPSKRITRRSLRVTTAEAKEKEQQAEGSAEPPNTITAQSSRGKTPSRSRKKAISSNERSTMPIEAEAMSSRRSGRIIQSAGRDVMRARRNYISEIAARSTNVDYVDLVSSPVVRVEGLIELDSDDDLKENINATTVAQAIETVSTGESLDDKELSFCEENPEMSVKVIWKGIPEIFKLRKYQKFGFIFKILGEREQTSEKEIVFNLDDRIISANDTPDSIKYKSFQFIYGRVWVQEMGSLPTKEKKKRAANSIKLKIQSDRFKVPLQLDLLKTDMFKILYIKCSEELNIPNEQIKLSCNGEVLERDETPENMEFEGGEAIDLHIKK